MYRFGKKFKRSNTFFYRSGSGNGKRNPQNSADTNVPSVSMSYREESVACNMDIDNKEECHAAEPTFRQESDNADYHQYGIIATEESNQQFQVDQNHISPVYHYAWLLMQFGYATDVFQQQSFALHDYNMQKRIIIHSSYVFVHRYPHKLPEGYGWVLCCSCDQSRMRFVQALNDEIGSNLSEAIPYPSCLHILAMERFLHVFDEKFGVDAEDFFLEGKKDIRGHISVEHSYIQMQPQEDLFSAVCGGMQWIAVKPVNGQWGVCTFVYSKVTPPKPELKCCSCSSYHCLHVTTLAKGLEGCHEEDDSPLALFKFSLEISPEMRDYFEMATRSKKKVQLFATGNENDANDFTRLPERNGSKFFAPSTSGCCSCGSEWDSVTIEDEWLDVERCCVAYLYTLHYVNVYYRMCSLCGTTRRFDGIENKVVWFGSFCISHAVLKDYIRLFLTSSLPMYKYYVAYVQRQVSSGNFTFPGEITYTKFRLSVIAMIRLLDIDFDDGFFCDICGKVPKKLVMDGTTLGIQKTYLPTHLVQSDTELLDGSRFEMRNFINRKRVRDLLKKYSRSETTLEEFQELSSDISSSGLKILLDSLEEQGLTSNCPKLCKRLLAALASDKPVCAIVQPSEEVLDLLTRMSDGVNPKDNPATDLKLLYKQVPLRFDILEKCGEFPLSIRPVVKELVSKSTSPFEFENGQPRFPHNLPPSKLNNTSNGYLPCLPELVQRGNYVLDSKKTQKGDCAKIVRAKKKHGTLIPGIFCILCPHGICYGFEIMRDHESPDIPFTILRTRFPKAPELVIYDNSCRLHEYCLNRDPTFFKNTKFVVDRFHWKNHKGCSEGYNMKLYPTLAVYNSQAAEQCNSTIKPLASMVSYMEYQNFILFSKLYIWNRNMRRIVKCNPDREVPYKDYFLNMSNVLH